MSLIDTGTSIDHLSDEQRECLENCTEAAQVCEWCADACLGDEEMEACAHRCRDAADVTALHARFMARDSEYSGDLATVCASVCEACAEECEQHDADHCQRCAEILSDCAETCRRMIV